MPLLLLFAVVLFLTTEMWQVFAEIDDASLVGDRRAAGRRSARSSLVARLPREVDELEAQVSGDGADPPLRRAQRLNVAW